MSPASLSDVEFVVRTMAQTAVDNEKYFGDLDAVVGDGDFGYSMARGFEKVIEQWDGFDRSDIGTFLKKVAIVITSRIGGTSGPIWGTAFLRAGTTAGATNELTGADATAAFAAVAATARESADATASMQAMRGRASYTGERSIGSVDAGAVGVAVMLERLAEAWAQRTAS
jgi:dihydroxyacetone kinase